jgi:hypothetical protein
MPFGLTQGGLWGTTGPTHLHPAGGDLKEPFLWHKKHGLKHQLGQAWWFLGEIVRIKVNIEERCGIGSLARFSGK